MNRSFQDYLHYNRGVLISELARVTTDLAQCYEDLAFSERQEREEKANSYSQSTITSIQGRDREAQINVITLTTDIIRTKGEISALIEEKELLHLLIQYAS